MHRGGLLAGSKPLPPTLLGRRSPPDPRCPRLPRPAPRFPMTAVPPGRRRGSCRASLTGLGCRCGPLRSSRPPSAPERPAIVFPAGGNSLPRSWRAESQMRNRSLTLDPRVRTRLLNTRPYFLPLRRRQPRPRPRGPWLLQSTSHTSEGAGLCPLQTSGRLRSPPATAASPRTLLRSGSRTAVRSPGHAGILRQCCSSDLCPGSLGRLAHVRQAGRLHRAGPCASG